MPAPAILPRHHTAAAVGTLEATSAAPSQLRYCARHLPHCHPAPAEADVRRAPRPEVEAELAEKGAEFRERGGEVYLPVVEATDTQGGGDNCGGLRPPLEDGTAISAG